MEEQVDPEQLKKLLFEASLEAEKVGATATLQAVATMIVPLIRMMRDKGVLTDAEINALLLQVENTTFKGPGADMVRDRVDFLAATFRKVLVP